MPQDGGNYRRVVGRNIARLRGAMTQDEMGAQVRRYLEGQWSKATVSAIENGKRPLEVSELVMLAIALDVSVADLLAPTQDGTLMTDDARVRFRDKKPSVGVDEVRRAVAPTSDEQAQEVYTKVIQVLAGNVSLDVAPQIAALGLSRPPKRARKK